MARRTNGKCFSIMKKVCVYWKIIGLCPFVLTDDGPGSSSYGAMFYTAILILAYHVCYCRAVINRLSYIMNLETPMVVIADFLGLSTEFSLVIAAWLYAIFRREEIQKILNAVKNIQDNSKLINIDLDFRKIFTIIKIYTTALNIGWILLYICDHVFIHGQRRLSLVIWLPFNLPRVVTHNVIIMFVITLWILKSFFRSLNKKIEQFSKEVGPRLAIPHDNRPLFINDGVQYFVTRSPLETYIQMHSDLVDLTKMIVDFFATSIILVLLLYLILLTADLYLMCLISRGPKFFNWKSVKMVAVFAGWWSLHLVETLILIAICDATVNEANRTGSVFHAMLLMDRSKRSGDLVQMLSLRLLQAPLEIELYGLIRMRLSLMKKIVGTVSTFITIMMQFDIQDLQQYQLDEL